MEVENLNLFLSFLKENLKAEEYDPDAYLEKLIIHWGETGRTSFSLNAEETRSGMSQDHHFLGDVVQWYMRYPGGICVERWDKVAFRPKFIEGLTFAGASHRLPACPPRTASSCPPSRPAVETTTQPRSSTTAAPRLQGSVRMTGPSGVMAMVCSK